MRRLTASKFGLAMRCSYWLRDEVPMDDSPMGQAAAEGNALHKMIECHLLGAADLPADFDAPRVVLAKYERWADWARSQKRIGWRPEVAYAYHAKSDTARELAGAGHRDYSDAREGEVAMTLDVVSFGEDVEGTYVEVIDWKSGQRSEAAVHQVSLGALAVARAHDIDRARVRVVYVGEDGVDVDEAWLSSFDLDMVRGQVLRVVERTDPEPVPGPHCSSLYCGARHACPATVQAMAEVTGQEVAELATLVASAITTPEAAGAAHVRLRVIKDAVKVVEERVRAVVEEHGSAPTPGGKVLRLVTSQRETFSRARLPKDRAEEILGTLRDVGALTSSESTWLKECSK